MAYDGSHLVNLDALKSLGTTAKSKIDNVQSNVDKLTGVYTVKGTQALSTNAWTGSLALSALYDGLTIQYYLPYAGTGDATLNLTLTGGTTSTTTGAIKVYMTGNTRMGTQYGAGSTITLTYWSAGSISIEGTATSEARWTSADYSAGSSYSAGTGIDITNSVISVDTSGVTADSYGPTTNPSPSAGGTFTVPSFTVDATGRLTAAADKTVTLPADSDTHVGVTKAETTKAYLLGTSTTPTTSSQDVVAVADTGVYLDTTAGHLTATQFNGSGAGINVGSAADNAVYTTTNGKLTAGSLATTDPTASGTATSFISSISQDSKGKITASKANIPAATGSVSGIVTLSDSTSSTSGAADGVAATPAAVKAVMDVATGAMEFKGTIGTGGTVTTLPDEPTKGDTYKVITAGTYAGTACKVGDTLICLTPKSGSTAATWTVIPSGDEPAGTVTNVATGSGLTGGPITTTGTISHADTSSASSVTASSRTYVDSLTLDDFGHVTAVTTSTETVTDTHYTANLITGASANAKADAAVSSGAVYMNLVENNEVRNSHAIEGSGATTVTADANGKITISSTDTTYSAANTTTEVAANDTVPQGTASTYARSDHTHKLPVSGATAGTYGPTADVTGNDGTTIKVPQVQVDKYGRVTSVSEFTLTNKNTSTTYTEGTGINISSNVISIEDTAVSADDYGPSADATLAHSGTFTVPKFTVDAQGRLTSAGNITYTLPASGNTDSKVKQTADSTTTTAAPLLFSAQTSPTSGNSYEAKYNTNVTVKASDGTLSASKFAGDGQNITLGTASKAVVTDANKKLTTSDLSTSDPTASGTATDFIATASQSATGKMTLTKASLPTASASVAGITKVGASSEGAAAYDHTHGNITNDGKLQTTDVTIANGDKIVVTDSSDSAKIARTSIAFDASTTTKALSQKGTWESFAPESHASAATTYGVGSTTNYGHVKLSDETNSSDGASSGVAATPAAVKAVMDIATSAMTFKGTIGTGGTVTTLPDEPTKGDTYKVITAGTYGGKSCKVGDTLICLTPKVGTTAATWEMIPSGDEPSGTVTNVATGSGLTGGPITSTGTISHADTSSVTDLTSTSRTYVNSLTFDEFGHVTAYSTGTETVTNTDSKVKQTADSSTTSAIPVLFSAQTTPTSGTNYEAKYNTNVTVKPSDGTLSATHLAGEGSGINVGTTSGYAVYTTTSGKLTSGTLATSDPTADGTSLTFIATASQDAKGKMTLTKKTVSTMGAAGASSAGTAGLVPAPGSGKNLSFLRGDGTWVIPDNNTYTPADTSTSVQAADTITQGTAATYARSDHSHNFPTSGVTAGAYGPSADVTGSDGTTISIPKITVDKYGRVTAASSFTLTNKNTTYTPASLGFGYGTCATAAATSAKSATLSGYELVAGGYVTIKFTYSVPASATLSINSKTAKAIYYNGSAIVAGVIDAGDTVTFVYDGTYYHVVEILLANDVLFSSASLSLATSRWSASGDSSYPYKAEITMNGVTASYYPVVQFSDDSSMSYEFSPVAITSDNKVTVYCKTAPSTAVTISSVTCYRGRSIAIS